MTEQEWLEKARKDTFNLTYLIDSYHPASFDSAKANLKITAPNAEFASEVIRQQIRDEADNEKPAVKFRAALDKGDVDALMSILNQAWVGVPESTSCWGIRGFSEAVSLLEDPPEPEWEGEEEGEGEKQND